MGFIDDFMLRPREDGSDLLSEIRSTVRLIRYTYLWFNAECDPDLIDACVYQLESLEARYRYLMRTARDQRLPVSDIVAQSDFPIRNVRT